MRDLTDKDLRRVDSAALEILVVHTLLIVAMCTALVVIVPRFEKQFSDFVWRLGFPPADYRVVFAVSRFARHYFWITCGLAALLLFGDVLVLRKMRGGAGRLIYSASLSACLITALLCLGYAMASPGLMIWEKEQQYLREKNRNAQIGAAPMRVVNCK